MEVVSRRSHACIPFYISLMGETGRHCISSPSAFPCMSCSHAYTFPQCVNCHCPPTPRSPRNDPKRDLGFAAGSLELLKQWNQMDDLLEALGGVLLR